MNLVIFGPPGAGKGTQSSFIVKKFNLFQLSTGELLRNEIKNNSKLGQEISTIINSGNLVSDTIVSNLIEKYISDINYKNRLIFDGYPRNLSQARNLDYLLEKYELFVIGGFFGMILASIHVIIKQVKFWKLSTYIIFFIGV